jgi:hypothetical protein
MMLVVGRSLTPFVAPPPPCPSESGGDELNVAGRAGYHRRAEKEAVPEGAPNSSAPRTPQPQSLTPAPCFCALLQQREQLGEEEFFFEKYGYSYDWVFVFPIGEEPDTEAFRITV